MTLSLIGYSLSGLIAVGIVFIGARFWWDPHVRALARALRIVHDRVSQTRR